MYWNLRPLVEAPDGVVDETRGVRHRKLRMMVDAFRVERPDHRQPDRAAPLNISVLALDPVIAVEAALAPGRVTVRWRRLIAGHD